MRETVDEFLVGLSDDEFLDFCLLLRIGARVILDLHDNGHADIFIDIDVTRGISNLLEGFDA